MSKYQKTYRAGGKESPTIVHLDPEITWRGVVGDTLSDQGMNVRSIARFTSIQALLGSQIPDLAILELFFPTSKNKELSGVDLAGELFAQVPELPILILSSMLNADKIYRLAKFASVKTVMPKQDIKGTHWFAEQVSALLPPKA